MVLVLQCFLSLFPAYAGVIPGEDKILLVLDPFPRIRGGDPIALHTMRKVYVFSPRMRR